MAFPNTLFVVCKTLFISNNILQFFTPCYPCSFPSWLETQTPFEPPGAHTEAGYLQCGHLAGLQLRFGICTSIDYYCKSFFIKWPSWDKASAEELALFSSSGQSSIEVIRMHMGITKCEPLPLEASKGIELVSTYMILDL